MSSARSYLSEIEAPSRAEVDAMPGWVLLEFGADWCGHCRGAQAVIAEALASHGQWRHIKIEDGPGRALGRSFRVRLWPTLILLRDGQEIGRSVRPSEPSDITRLMGSA